MKISLLDTDNMKFFEVEVSNNQTVRIQKAKDTFRQEFETYLDSLANLQNTHNLLK